MNKLLTLFVGLVVFASISVAKAVDIEAWSIKEITLSSDSIKGSCYIGAVYLSTPVENTALNAAYAVLIASPVATANAPFSAYSSAQKLSPPLVYVATNPLNGSVMGGNYEAINYGERGIFVSTDCTLWKTNASSGEAFKAFIKYRK